MQRQFIGPLSLALLVLTIVACGGGGGAMASSSGGTSTGGSTTGTGPFVIPFTNVQNSNANTAPFQPNTIQATQGASNIDIFLQQGNSPTERGMELVLKTTTPTAGQSFDLSVFDQGTLVYEENQETKNWDSFSSGGSGMATITAVDGTTITLQVTAHLVPGQSNPGTGTFDLSFTRAFTLTH